MTKRHPMLERVIDHDARAAGWGAVILGLYTGIHHSSWGRWLEAPDQPVSQEAEQTLTLVLTLREQLDRCHAAMMQYENDHQDRGLEKMTRAETEMGAFNAGYAARENERNPYSSRRTTRHLKTAWDDGLYVARTERESKEERQRESEVDDLMAVDERDRWLRILELIGEKKDD